MPIGIGVNGGPLRQIAVEDLSSEKALTSLQQIRAHLSQPGRDSGVLTLFNRTSLSTEMTLERKSGFQLLFHKEERLDETVLTLKTLLQQAGEDDAVDELENYLSSQSGRQNRIESSKMFEILNRHLPPLEKGTSMRNLFTLARMEVGQELGSGQYGSTYLLDVDGRPNVLKQFDRPEILSLKRSAHPNEAMGSYLTSRNYPNYLSDKVNISQPTSYLVSTKTEGKREFQMIGPREMRSLVKEAVKTGAEVSCHGLVMPRAKGKEVEKLIDEASLSEPQKKQVIKSTLQSVRGLNERGFVHRDIKPANTFFDGTTQTATLIDTGSLFKTSKNLEKHPGTDYIDGSRPAGSPVYMHPRALQREDHGTETDLYAVGVMSLQVDHPAAFWQIVVEIGKQNWEGDGVSHDWLRGLLDTKIADSEPTPLRDALVALRNDIDDPNTLSGFAMECFRTAHLAPELWANREWAQAKYDELLTFPGLR